jgi:hypothetical protein
LGAVSVDIHKQEREYENLTLSDDNVVRYLILYRNKVDVSYGANTNININFAGDMFEFNQELICLYASLDETVKEAKLTERQTKLLELLYEGNTVKDASEILELKRNSVFEMLDRIVNRIVSTNNELWYYTTGHNGYILTKK